MRRRRRTAHAAGRGSAVAGADRNAVAAGADRRAAGAGRGSPAAGAGYVAAAVRSERGAAAVRSERGAAAVELALLLPVLLLIVFGIIDFGRALNAQITLTQAAREGARLTALNEANVTSRTQAAATGLKNVTVTVVDSCPAGATGDTDAVVKVSYTFAFVTPVGKIAAMFGGSGYGSPITLSAQGVMPCEQ